MAHCVRPVRKDWIHSRAFSWMPASWSLVHGAVGDGVEGSREVQEDEGCNFVSVEVGVDVVCGGEEDGLRNVIASEAGLREVQDVVRLDKLGKLGVDCLLDDLGWKGEQRDGSEVLEVSRSAEGFFSKGLISTCFQSSRNVAGLMEQLMVQQSSGAMEMPAVLKMWFRQGFEGDPEWMLLMILRVSSVVRGV